MDTIRVVGIAKSVFQVCIWMDDGSAAWNKNLTIQIAGYRSTIRARNAYRYEGLLNFSFLGKNVQRSGILCVPLHPKELADQLVTAVVTDKSYGS